MKTILYKVLFGLIFLLIGSQVQAQFFTEDFGSGIPQGWTTVVDAGDGTSSASWMYTTTGPQGPAPTFPINSTTASNGWMIFDSDLNCSGNQDTWLISPPISCADKDFVILQFENYYRRYGDRTFVEVSTDLTEWHQYEVFENSAPNDYSCNNEPNINPCTLNIDISEHAASEEFVYFAFHYVADGSTANGVPPGCAYNWQIDDIALLDYDPTPLNDLTINHVRRAQNYATPISQIDTFRFAANIGNIGLNSQHDITVRAEILKGTSILFTTTTTLDSLEAGKDSTIYFSDYYLPSNIDIGTYQLRYIVDQQEDDAQVNNNTFDTNFKITTNEFWRDNGEIPTATQPLAPTENWMIGNYFITPNNGGDQNYYAITEAIFSVASDSVLVGETVGIRLYKVEEDDDPIFTDDDLVLVGANDYTFVSGDNNYELFVVDILDINDAVQGVAIENYGEYFLMIEYTKDMYCPYSELDYRYDIGSVLKDPANGGEWFLGGFGEEVTAQIRMRIESVVPTKNILDDRHQVNIFPNPADEMLFVDVELVEQINEAEVSIHSLDGKVLLQESYSNLKKEQFSFDLKKFSNGVYLFQIKTDIGLTTKRFVVQH